MLSILFFYIVVKIRTRIWWELKIWVRKGYSLWCEEEGKGRLKRLLWFGWMELSWGGLLGLWWEIELVYAIITIFKSSQLSILINNPIYIWTFFNLIFLSKILPYKQKWFIPHCLPYKVIYTSSIHHLKINWFPSIFLIHLFCSP